MDPSTHTTSATKQPPKLTRGLLQGPPLPSTRYPYLTPSTKVLKIGDKELTFHMSPLQEGEESKQKQGVHRSLWGIGRGAGVMGGKPELPFSRLERMQNMTAVVTQESIESCDWLGELGGESMPIDIELEGSRKESDWSSEREEMSANSELELRESEFLSTSPVTKESSDKPQFELASSDKILYILRGCPGSGKSTLAAELRGERGRIFSTDEYFVGSDGEYVFDPKKVAVYHKRNQERAREAVREGVSPVVIDNTNTTVWEMRPYVETGVRHGYRVQFVEPDTSWRYDPEQLSLRNSHGVPLDSIKRMLKRFQKNPTVESVLGKSAVERIQREKSVGEFEIEDELSSNQDTLNSSTEECKSAGSSPTRDKTSISDLTPLLSSPPRAPGGEDPVDPLAASSEEPDRYSLVLEPETTEGGTVESQTPPRDSSPPTSQDQETPQIGPLNSRNVCLVSNQERFNQQLVQELTNSPRGNSLFCLNLQSLTVLQDILNIDKTLLAQKNFPLPQLLLPPHVISQLSHTQVANFQHNYQRYLQHIMQTRSQEIRPFIPKGNSVPTPHVSPRNQSVYSQARMQSQIPPVFSHQRMNHRLPAQNNPIPTPGEKMLQQKQFNMELKQEPKLYSTPISSVHIQNSQIDEKKYFHSNQGMQPNSMELNTSKETQNEPINSQCSTENIPLGRPVFESDQSTSDSLLKGINTKQQNSLQQTNNKEINLRDTIFPNVPETSNPIDTKPDNNQISETSYELEQTEIANDDVTNISPTLSPSDRSISTSGTLENNSFCLTPKKPYMDTRPLNTDNGEEAHDNLILALTTDNIQDSHSIRFKLTGNQDLISPVPSVLFEGLDNQIESNKEGVNDPSSDPSGTETKCFDNKEAVQLNEHTMDTAETNPIQILPTNISPYPCHEPDTMKRILSEKIDWGDSSDSEKCVSSPIESPDILREQTRPLDRPPRVGLIAPWDTWTGWSSNFITHNNHTSVSTTVPDPIISDNNTEKAIKKSFDPTIQPPRKHSSSSCKSTNENLDFTPSFYRIKSQENDTSVRSPQRLSVSGESTPTSRPKWSTYVSTPKENKSVLPAGGEWQWSKVSGSRNNGNSENSSPRSDSEDPRNSRPLNPFAVPWKPFLPSNKPRSISSEDTEKLGHLRGFFPTLSAKELQASLTEYDNDIDKTVEALIEQAEAHNLDLPMSSQVPLPNKMAKKIRSPKKSEKVTTPLDASAPEFKTELLDDIINAKWQQNNSTDSPTSTTSWCDTSVPIDTYIESSSLANPSQSALSFPDASIDTSPLKTPYTPLVLQLDSNLAQQLIRQFGPLPGYTREASLDHELSQIALTEETSLLLHQLWCKSIAPVDRYYVSPGQGAAWLPPENPAQQAKIQLYNLYPGIDTQALDEILRNKNFSLSAANEYISSALTTAQKASKDSLTSFALITQRASQSFPPLPTKPPRNSTPIFSSQNAKTIL